MKKFILILPFIFFVFFSNAQTDYAALARQYAEQGNYEEAIKIEKENLELIEKTIGKNNSNYAASLNNLANYNSSLGHYQEAVRLGTEALKIREEVLGKNHPDYAMSLDNLASYNYYLGNYQEAIRLGTEALKIYEEILGKNHLDYAVSLNNLANYNARLGNYQEAIRLGTEVLNILEEVVGKNHPDYAVSLNNLANYNSSLGNYQEAIRLGTEALKIREEVLGRNHSGYATSLNNLAKYNSRLGNYQEAIRLGTEALEIFEEILGKTHPGYAMSLHNLADYNSRLGHYQEAIRLGSEALKIREEVLGTNHPDYAASLHNLADYNSRLGNYQEAIRLGSEALKIREEVLGTNHPDYAMSLNSLALYNYYLGNYPEAVRLGTETLEIFEEGLGRDHPGYAMSLHNLASYNFGLGNYPEAMRLESEALEIFEKILGTNHPYIIETLSGLSRVYYKLNDISNLKSTARQVSGKRVEYLKNNFITLPLSEREKFWAATSDWFSFALPRFAFDCADNEILTLALNAILLSKGILLNSEIEFDKFLTETGSPNLAAKYNEIKSLRLRLNKLYEKPIAEHGHDTDSLERVANNLERELMYESKEFGDYTRNLSVTWKDVQKGLKKKEIAIEFMAFPLNQDSTMYMAYVLKPDTEFPEMVKLFEEKEIEKYRNPNKYQNDEATELVWRKLRPYLDNCENIYFAPDGILHQIAIEYFPDFDGESTMSDKYRIHRLSSTRQLAINREHTKSNSAAVYGGIVYDNDIASMESESRKYWIDEGLMASRGFNTLIKDADILNTRGGVKYLDGTKTEAEEVNRLLMDNNYQTQLIIGQEATEESFKNLSGKNNDIIHIATHGFYWKEDEAERLARSNERLTFMSQLNDDGPKYVEDKALTRSGLLMAGANNILRGKEIPEGVDDGILTAREIAQMNLRGTDLVVLSACQTGMGEISGDGVFGLQRSFKKAGVNSIIMSLWNVNDQATNILMTEFYRNFLDGMPKGAAFKAAQRKVRETPGFNKPYYWAAFILLDALN